MVFLGAGPFGIIQGGGTVALIALLLDGHDPLEYYMHDAVPVCGAVISAHADGRHAEAFRLSCHS